MKSKQQLIIELTTEEKTVLRNAQDVLENVKALLEDNRANQHYYWQDGMIISDCFWQLAKLTDEIRELEP